MKRTNQLLTLCVLSLLVSVGAAAQNFDGFRGPNRDGLYPDEKGLLKQWPQDGPQLLWESTVIGKGYSSPVVVGDRLYVTGMNDDQSQEVFFAFDLNGKMLYSTPYGKPWKNSYPETRTTPTVNGGKAYVISGMGDVVCINCADGKIVWSVDGATKYASATGNWGTAECPLVFDNKVIYCPGGNQTTMVAFNKDTGAELWKTRSLSDPRNYTQPTLISYKGRKQIIGGTRHYFYGVNPDNGEIEWSFQDWGAPDNPENISPNGPIFNNGQLMFAQGYGINATALKLADDLKSVSIAWTSKDLSTHHGGYVLVDGVVYGSNWINNSSGNWVALDWATGKTLYNNAWSGGKSKGSIVYADGMLYSFDERRGFVGLVRPGKDKFDVVSEFRVSKGSGSYWAHLVIHDGIMYVRHGEYMAAYKVK